MFVPAGQSATLTKQFAERGIARAGIKLYGGGDITNDEVLASMGDVALGVITAHHYPTDHQSEKNKAFVTAFKQSAGDMRPNFFSVGGYDGMYLVPDVTDPVKAAKPH